MRKLFKKSLACCLALALCFTLFAGAITVNAELTTNPSYSTEDVTVAPGESTTIKFTIADFAEIQGVILKVYVPSVVASIDKVTVDGIDLVEWSDETGEGNYQVDNENKFVKFMTLANFEGVDTVDALTFDINVTVDAEAEAGEYGYTAPVIQATDGDDLVTINGQFGKFTVVEKEPEVHEHSWSDWNVVTEATSSANGSKTRSCTCGVSETKVIPRILKFNTYNLTLEDLIAVNFKANGDHFTSVGYTDPYMKVIVNGEETIVTEYTIETDSRARRVFSFSITPQMLKDNIEAYLCATYEGEEYVSAVVSLDVAGYCYKQLPKEDAVVKPAMKTLLVDLLEYATSLQVYNNYNTANLANADLTEDQKAMGTEPSYEKTSYTDIQDAKYIEIANPAVTWKSVSLFLADIVEVRLKATLPKDISNIRLVVEGGFGPYEVPSSEFELQSDGSYIIKFTKAMAHQMDDSFYYTIYDGDTAISNTVLTSAESYVAKNIAKTGDTYEKLRPVLARMMNYGRSADAARK